MKAHTDSPPGTRRALHIALYRWAAAIFVLGLACSSLIYVFADDETADLQRQVTSAKMYQHNIQLTGAGPRFTQRGSMSGSPSGGTGGNWPTR